MIFDFGTFVTTAFWIAVASIPLGIVALSALHAARTPQWVWAFSDRTQVIWVAGLFWGVIVVPLGLFVAAYYWWRVRPQLASIERGEI